MKGLQQPAVWREVLRKHQVQIEAAVFEPEGRVARTIKTNRRALDAAGDDAVDPFGNGLPMLNIGRPDTPLGLHAEN